MTTGPRHHVSSGSTFEEQVGYSRAVYDDHTVWVAGTTGFDYATMTIADVVRVRYLLVDADDFPPCWPVLREAFAVARPAATMLVVAGLADPRMRIEIEATARRPRPGAA